VPVRETDIDVRDRAVQPEARQDLSERCWRHDSIRAAPDPIYPGCGS
jgi:hypothetical protein